MNIIERHASLFFGFAVGSLLWNLMVFLAHAGQGGC